MDYSKKIVLRLLHFIVVLLVLQLSTACTKSNTIQSTCTDSLVSYDWVYPDYNNAVGAFKFSSDKSFNYSTTMFGGVTRYGTWKSLDHCSFELKYSNGDIKVITISNGRTFKIGSTTYYAY
mgnify:CR=1 FL=1|tara:strand:+ start:274 stop:636 length:363 start_codon:yes stop_codon:yes gene_type:complete